MSDTPDLGRLIAYCSHLGRQHVDLHLRQAGYDVTPVQSRTLAYLACQPLLEAIKEQAGPVWAFPGRKNGTHKTRQAV